MNYGSAPDTSIYSASAIQSQQYPPIDEKTLQYSYPPPVEPQTVQYYPPPVDERTTQYPYPSPADDSKSVQYTYTQPVPEKVEQLPANEASYPQGPSADATAFDMKSMSQALPVPSGDATGLSPNQHTTQDAQRSVTPASNHQGYQPHLGFPPEAFGTAPEVAPPLTPQPTAQSMPQVAPQPVHQSTLHDPQPVSMESLTPAPLALNRGPPPSLPPRSQTFPSVATPNPTIPQPFSQPHTHQPVASTTPQPPMAGQLPYGAPAPASQPLPPHLMASQLAAQMASQMSPPPPPTQPVSDPNAFRRHSVMTTPSTHSAVSTPSHYHRHSIAQPVGYLPPAQATHAAPVMATHTIPEEPQYEPVAIPQAYRGNHVQSPPQHQVQQQPHMFPPTPMSLPTSPSNLPPSHRHSVSYFPSPPAADKPAQTMYFQQQPPAGMYYPQHAPYTPGATPGSQLPTYQ